MERRSHRIAVLLVVVLLHVPLLFAIRDWLAWRVRPGQAAREMVVEFVLNEAPPPPMVSRSRQGGRAAASDAQSRRPVVRAPLDSRLRGNDGAPQDGASRENEALREDEIPPDDVRLFATDGSLRIPSTMSEDIAPKVAEGPNTFHIPAGDTWILREPAAPIEFVDTRFSQVFLPEGMNPVEEACWRNKGFAFIMTMLGSLDCAAPGQKDRRPTPQMIVYGVDDADDILRKTEDWARYNER